MSYKFTWWRHQMVKVPALLAPWVGNSPVIGEFPHNGQRREALMFSLICAWINGCVKNRYAGDLRRHRAHYDGEGLGVGRGDAFICSYTVITLMTPFPYLYVISTSLLLRAKSFVCMCSIVNIWHKATPFLNESLLQDNAIHFLVMHSFQGRIKL